MTPLADKLLWTALVMALALGILFDLSSLPEDISRVHHFPAEGLGFTSVEIPLSSSELSLYTKAEVIKRYYQLGRDRFMLIAIDGAKNRHAVHDPMYCFQGAGWRVAEKNTVPFEGGEALVLLLEKDGSYREVAYWFTDGKNRHTSVVRYWIQATLRRISMGRSGKEPLLVMLQSVDDNPVNFRKIFDQFGVLFLL